MGRVTGKYMIIGYGDEEGKTRPHLAPLPCLLKILTFKVVYIDTCEVVDYDMHLRTEKT
ncbi:hypothetical protein MTR_7g050570 [Medicago truncatula]|uniref:Uncharacterized protein n=1 Tax=Medicago truncatula TaxID=3880 RepID=G7KVV5_MEDTR|nr:hypothetical protein MTR_7g050570 [Medicago truncatula]